MVAGARRNFPAREGTFRIGQILKREVKVINRSLAKKSLEIRSILSSTVGNDLVFEVRGADLIIYVKDNRSSFVVTMKKDRIKQKLDDLNCGIRRISIVKNPSAYRDPPALVIKKIVKNMLKRAYGK